jgi:uncharacterized protein (TIGR02147 family)
MVDELTLNRLLTAKDYRQFIKTALSSSGKKVNYSALSRRAGFSSRSYFKEVVDGRKGMSVASMKGFRKALKLEGQLGTYFETLVSLTERDCNYASRSSDELQSELEKIRKKIRTGRVGLKAKSSSGKLFASRHSPEIYAALGSLQFGATVGEMIQKTGLSKVVIESVLKIFVENGFCSVSGDRYFASESVIDLTDIGGDKAFQDCYLGAIETLKRKSAVGFESKTELYSYSAFSMRSEKMAEFKQKLNVAILECLDQYQDDDGDAVVKVLTGLYR